MNITAEQVEQSAQIIQAALRGQPLDETTTHVKLHQDLKGLKTFTPLLVAKSLERLDIYAQTLIPPLDGITALAELRSIRFGDQVKIKSLAALEHFPKLDWLSLGKIYPLLDGLRLPIRTLHVHSTTIDRVDYFRHCEYLDALRLGDSAAYANIGDTASFAAVPRLKELSLTSRSLTTLKALSVLTELRSIELTAMRRLKSLDGLQGLTHLEALACNATSIRDLAPASGDALRFLHAGQTDVASLRGLRAPQLLQLWLHHTRLPICDLGDAPLLEALNVASTPLERLDEIGALTTLKVLNLADCPNIRDFTPLERLTQLEILNLKGAALNGAAFERLLALPNLTLMNIARTPAAETPAGKDAAADYLRDPGQRRTARVCDDNTTFNHVIGNRDRRVNLVCYYLSCYRGANHSLAHLSTKGYHA